MNDLVERLRKQADRFEQMNSMATLEREAADRIEELEADLEEQCRINGMGSEREARLLARVEELERAARMALEAFVITATDKQMKAITALRDALGEQK